ncbi:MAG: hypothetical protein DRJ05_00960 [Bacteroidetes bacterium]|nr:MAG: hypothetical protein DRI89_08780 [Bacteroidota bacterium]RLD62182.1 MAG: hypothetical protein DRJ05_00960 [Bacteroidota bacterium]
MKNSLNSKLLQTVLIVSALNLFLPLMGQEQVYFNKRIDHHNNKDNARNIIETDSGYVIGAYTYDADPAYMYEVHLTITGINYQGEETFYKEYGYDTINMFFGNPGSLIRYSDDKYMSVGTYRIFKQSFSDDRGMLICYNVDFDTLWMKHYAEKTVPHDTAFMFYQVKKTIGGGLIMTGLRNPGSSKFHAWLIKTDSLGSMLWERFYGDGVEYYSGHSVVQTADGGYVIGGFKYLLGMISRGDPLIIKTDSLGIEEWRINPGNPDIDDNKAMIALAADGNIIVGTNYGIQESGLNQWMVVKIMKISPDGDVLWDYNYGDPGYDKFLLNTTVLENGNIITNGVVSYFGNDDPVETSWILCVDSVGTQLWYKEYVLLEGFNTLNDVRYTSTDHGLIGCGMADPIFPEDTGNPDIWVMKMDSVGCLEAGCDTTVVVIEYGENEKVRLLVFPNPVQDVLSVNIKGNTCESSQIEVYNMYGLKVEEVIIPPAKASATIHCRSWSDGMYVVRLKANSKTLQNVKLIKQ